MGRLTAFTQNGERWKPAARPSASTFMQSGHIGWLRWLLLVRATACAGLRLGWRCHEQTACNLGWQLAGIHAGAASLPRLEGTQPHTTAHSRDHASPFATCRLPTIWACRLRFGCTNGLPAESRCTPGWPTVSAHGLLMSG